MSFINPSRRGPAASSAAPAGDSGPGDSVAGSGLGVRPGAGVLGMQRPEPAAKMPQAEAETSSQGTLIVGEGIAVKGEIQSCTTLIVEGRVEASLEAEKLTVRDGGVYDGKAVVEMAWISGNFSGDLTVRGSLTIAAGGRVSGSLRYGDLRIEHGGRLSGDVDLLAEEAPAKVSRKPDTHEAARAAVDKAQAEGEARAQREAVLQRKEPAARP